MELIKLLSGTGIECPGDLEKIEVKGIAYDSRNVEPGFAFVCITGFKQDGHQYAASAAEKGASVVFTERYVEGLACPQIVNGDNRKVLSAVSASFYGNPTEELNVFGVTGTNGKTTISYLMKEILEAAGFKTGLLGTIAYTFGDKKYESKNTTPESCELQKLFAEMKADGAQACSMEVSSHALALSRVADVKFDYSVFTNLTPDHMDFHKDFEDYYGAKKKLFYMTEKSCVINIDDDYGQRMCRELRSDGINAKSFSIRDKIADYYGEIVEMNSGGSRIRVVENGSEIGVMKVWTPGRFSASNALAAAAVCTEAGIGWDCIKQGIGGIKGVPGRFQRVENNRDLDVIVDYAHTPDALENVLKTAREFTEGRLIAVFGCGGDRDRTKRPIMGRTAGKLADFCLVTSDNPRTEDPEAIVKEVEAGVKETDCGYRVITDRRAAIQAAVNMWQKGDVIVIAGKGHEDYQIVGTVKHHFDDREEALAAIGKR